MVSKMITDRHVFGGQVIQSTGTELCCQKAYSMWECWQDIYHYRYRFSLELEL